jgi:GAF domain-containing protein
MSKIETQEHNRSIFSRLWMWISSPHPEVTEIGERRRAQLLAGLSLILALTTSLGFITTTFPNSQENVDSQSASLLGLALFSIFTYGLSRTRYYQLGSIILAAIFSIASIVDVVETKNMAGAIYFLIPIYALSSALFKLRGISILVIFNTLFTFILPVVDSTVDPAFADTGIIMTVGILLMIVVAFRNLVERERLAEVAGVNQELEELSGSLETRVNEAVGNLALAAEVGRRVSLVRDPAKMLADAVELIRERFDLYYTQIYLTDSTGRNLILRAGTGDVGRTLIQRSHRLPVDFSSINGTAAVEQRAVIVSDTTSSEIHRPNPLLSDTRSEMSVPLIAGERVVGVLDLQSSQPGALSEAILPAFEALAGQLAITIVNANLFTEIEQTRRDVESQARRLSRESWGDFLDAIERREYLGYNYEDAALTPLLEPISTEAGENTLVTAIQVSGEPVGTLKFEGDQPWSNNDSLLVSAVAQQVAQQIDNLRLLAQSEHYQREAQKALRRLTREGWREYQDALQSGVGFVYQDYEVKPLDNGAEDSGEVFNYPIEINEVPIGEFSIPGKTKLSEADTELVASIGEQLSAHIENLRLSQQTEQALSQAEILYEIGRQLNLATNEEEILSAVSSTAMKVGCKQTSLMYIDQDQNGKPEWLRIVAAWSRESAEGSPVGTRFSATQFPLMAALLARPDKPLLISDVANAPQIDDGLRGRWMSTGIRAMCIIPLAQVGQWLGMLTLSWDEAHEFSHQEDVIFESLVSLMTPAVQSHRLFGEAQDRAAELATVAEVGTKIASILDPQEMLQTVVNLAKERFGLYHAHVYLLDDDAKLLNLAVGAGEVGQKMVAEGWQISLEAPQSLVARAARERRGVIVSNVFAEPGFMPNPLLPDTASELAVPLMVGNTVFGVLDVQSEEKNHFTQEDVNIQTTLASQVAVALQNAQTYALIQRQAEHETLINVISQRIQSTTNIENALQVTIRELGRALGAKRTSVQLGGWAEKK